MAGVKRKRSNKTDGAKATPDPEEEERAARIVGLLLRGFEGEELERSVAVAEAGAVRGGKRT